MKIKSDAPVIDSNASDAPILKSSGRTITQEFWSYNEGTVLYDSSQHFYDGGLSYDVFDIRMRIK